MKYVLGSGITGLMARYILGDDWTVIPFGKSRFFTFSPALCDNYLIADPQVDSIVSSLGFSTVPAAYKRVYSLGGHLMPATPDLTRGWLERVYDGAPPAHMAAYLASRHVFFIYQKVWINKLYTTLLRQYHDHISEQARLGKVTEIGDHYLVRGGKKLEFERVVSTIPLKALLDLQGRQLGGLKFKPLQYVHLETTHLDFEGSNQTFVADPIFSFHKVTALGKKRYLFYFHEEVRDMGQYFMPILADYDLIDGTSIGDALIASDMPDLSWLEKQHIFPVGSYAQHDACADVSSNMLRLLKYAGRGFVPKKKVLV